MQKMTGTKEKRTLSAPPMPLDTTATSQSGAWHTPDRKRSGRCWKRYAPQSPQRSVGAPPAKPTSAKTAPMIARKTGMPRNLFRTKRSMTSLKYIFDWRTWTTSRTSPAMTP